MLRDAHLWEAIRRRVLIDGASKRQVRREAKIHWSTLEKVLRHESPPEFKRPPRRRPALGHFEHYIEEMLEHDRGLPRKWRRSVRQIHRCLQGYGYRGGYSTVRDYVAAKEPPGIDEGEALLDEILGSPPRQASALLAALAKIPPNRLSSRDLRALRRGLKRRRAESHAGVSAGTAEDPHRWMLRVLQCQEPVSQIKAEVGDLSDLDRLLKDIRKGGLRARNKALAVLAHHRGVSFRSIARFLHLDMRAVSEYCSTYRLFGYQRLVRGFYDRSRVADDERLQNTLFAILHTPPKDYDMGYNQKSLTGGRKAAGYPW